MLFDDSGLHVGVHETIFDETSMSFGVTGGFLDVLEGIFDMLIENVGDLFEVNGSRLKAGNETMIQLVEKIRERTGYEHIEPCFMELGKPLIPVAIRKLVREGCNHIFGYALFLVPGSHLSEDIPFIFEQTLRKHPEVTWEISPPMMSDPMMVDFVAKHIDQALDSV